MIRCIIVDDEQYGINVIETHVKQTQFMELVLATTNPFDAISKIITEKIDLVFLDIHMPQMSGMEFIKTIHGKAKIILCTAYAEYALEGYEHDVVDYLMKPISYPRFIKAVQKATTVLQQASPSNNEQVDDFLFVKTEQKGKMVKVNFAEVSHIESMANYVAFIAGGKKTIALFTMKEVASLLPKQRFIRVHNSFIVNSAFVLGIEGNTISLKNVADKIPISSTYKNELLEALNIKKT